MRESAIPLVDARPLQQIDERMAELIRQRNELLAACRALANEASGFLSMATREEHGLTNMRVLQHWIDNARAAIANAEERS